MQEPESVQHMTMACPMFAAIRAETAQRLQMHLSQGLLEQLGEPMDAFEPWMRLLLQAPVVKLGEEYAQSFHSLKYATDHSVPKAKTGQEPSLAKIFEAEITRETRQTVVDDRRGLASIGLRYIIKIVSKRNALERAARAPYRGPARRKRIRDRR